MGAVEAVVGRAVVEAVGNASYDDNRLGTNCACGSNVRLERVAAAISTSLPFGREAATLSLQRKVMNKVVT
ncbi:MAG: hypothetical protein EOO38_26140 [Cytophagaceae bacterium]|nr:MAG: hypothetical protein EOO38_26140 [Cytophagaceae bacterium]